MSRQGSLIPANLGPKAQGGRWPWDGGEIRFRAESGYSDCGRAVRILRLPEHCQQRHIPVIASKRQTCSPADRTNDSLMIVEDLVSFRCR